MYESPTERESDRDVFNEYVSSSLQQSNFKRNQTLKRLNEVSRDTPETNF